MRNTMEETRRHGDAGTRSLAIACLLAAVLLSAMQDRAGAADDPTREEILLWPKGAPGAIGNEPADRPMITLHHPKAGSENGCAVIVCPGGGYGHLANTYEGHDVAEWFNSFGVTAFVLQYRLAPRYKHPAPLSDVQRAVRTVRTRAAEWKVDPQRIGVLGFSAGGHLTSTAGTHFDNGNPKADDVTDRSSCRPDFLVLCYPVVSFTTEHAHAGSRKNLLGDNPDAALVKLLSNELQVTKDTPPTFLFHTNEDSGVVPENSVLFYLALRQAGVPAELHIYETGPHGVGMAQDNPALASWPFLLRDWMRSRKLLAK